MKRLSASKIGFPCEVNLYYASIGIEGKYDKETEKIFKTGKHLEKLVVDFLKEEGHFVLYNGKEHGNWDFEIEISNGIICGVYDAIIQFKDDEEFTLVDIKTMNSTAFYLWKRAGTLRKYPWYADQVTIYYWGLRETKHPLAEKIKKLAVVGFNKNTSEIYIDFFNYNEENLRRLIKKCEKIFSYEEEPKPVMIPRWVCDYCEYSYMCKYYQGGKIEYDGEIIIDDYEIEEIIALLQKAEDLEYEARSLREQARLSLGKYSKYKTVKGVSSNYILSHGFKETEFFDFDAFKEEHPDLFKKYTRKKFCYNFEIKKGGES